MRAGEGGGVRKCMSAGCSSWKLLAGQQWLASRQLCALRVLRAAVEAPLPPRYSPAATMRSVRAARRLRKLNRGWRCPRHQARAGIVSSPNTTHYLRPRLPQNVHKVSISPFLIPRPHLQAPRRRRSTLPAACSTSPCISTPPHLTTARHYDRHGCHQAEDAEEDPR